MSWNASKHSVLKVDLPGSVRFEGSLFRMAECFLKAQLLLGVLQQSVSIRGDPWKEKQ